jgi:hypothetical protein
LQALHGDRRGNIRFESTINGESVSFGAMAIALDVEIVDYH